MGTMSLGLAVLYCAIFGAVCAFIAQKKNRNGVVWFVLGALFSFFALIAVAVVPALPNRSSPAQSNPAA